jgi:hypothetical protein
MASYFDEHDCEPLGENERPNNDLLLARLLLDSGIADALGLDFESLMGLNPTSSGSQLPPPTSKEWLKNAFETKVFDESLIHGTQCPICLKEFVASNQNDHVSKTAISLPCKHSYHTDCIKLWLEQTSSCPSCRLELPTDDANYEQFKLQRKRTNERKKELESLHDSMYT